LEQPIERPLLIVVTHIGGPSLVREVSKGTDEQVDDL
jgi:hypothetical protein